MKGNKVWAGVFYALAAAGVVYSIVTGNLFHLCMLGLPLAISLSCEKEEAD